MTLKQRASNPLTTLQFAASLIAVCTPFFAFIMGAHSDSEVMKAKVAYMEAEIAALSSDLREERKENQEILRFLRDDAKRSKP